jgi:hypothetical protein
MSRELGLVALLALGCSDASLYRRNAEDLRPDRVSLTGEVCTTDPRLAGFRTRLLLVVDTAAGPMFASYDRESSRLTALREVVARYTGTGRFGAAVVSMGPYARKLAPTDAAFSVHALELDGAIDQLALPQGCIDGRCRDYDEAFELARAVVEEDLAASTAGERHRTSYEVVFVTGGPASPGTDDLPEQVARLRASVEDAGALSFRLHTLQLGDDLDATLLTQLAQLGGGRYEAFQTSDAITLDRLELVSRDEVLEPKALLVHNPYVRPTASGPVADLDADGLTDAEERDAGTRVDLADSDFDGVDDLVELLVGTSPREADVHEACAGLADEDVDDDGLNACAERLVGSDPTLPDTDGDGLPDGLELRAGTNHLEADLFDDADRDGVPNGDELPWHTDPVSADAAAHLQDAYRYDVVDEGTRELPSIAAPRGLPGLRVLDAAPGLLPGLGTLAWQPPTLSWTAPDDVAGRAVEIVDGTVTLTSGTPGRWIRVAATPERLPPTPVAEQVVVTTATRHCVSWTVRNVRLVEGHNPIRVQLAEAPLGRMDQPGTYRTAIVPVTWDTLLGRLPPAPTIEVPPEAFDAEETP